MLTILSSWCIGKEIFNFQSRVTKKCKRILQKYFSRLSFYERLVKLDIYNYNYFKYSPYNNNFKIKAFCLIEQYWYIKFEKMMKFVIIKFWAIYVNKELLSEITLDVDVWWKISDWKIIYKQQKRKRK